MTEIQIKLVPGEYRGFALSWSNQSSGKNFRGTKGLKDVFAASPSELIAEIDKIEKITARISPPIKALMRDDYSGKREPVEIHTVIDDKVYFKKQSGEEGLCWLKDMRPDAEKKRKFIQCCKANEKTLQKYRKQADKIRFMSAMNEELLKRLIPVTDADVLIAAKNSCAHP